MATDEAAAEEYLRAFGDEAVEAARPSFTEFGPTEAILAGVYDALRDLYGAFIVANSKKGRKLPEIPRWPRPETAMDRVRKRVRRQDYDEVKQMLLGGRN